METPKIDLDDLELKKPGSFGAISSQVLCATMNTATLERLAVENPTITFIHSYPGWVDTGNITRGLQHGSAKSWLAKIIFGPLFYMFSYNDAESGQRHLFQSTNAAFGGRGVPWSGKPAVTSTDGSGSGNGLLLVNYRSDCVSNAELMRALREKGMAEIWDYTQEVLEEYL